MQARTTITVIAFEQMTEHFAVVSESHPATLYGCVHIHIKITHHPPLSGITKLKHSSYRVFINLADYDRVEIVLSYTCCVGSVPLSSLTGDTAVFLMKMRLSNLLSSKMNEWRLNLIAQTACLHHAFSSQWLTWPVCMSGLDCLRPRCISAELWPCNMFVLCPLGAHCQQASELNRWFSEWGNEHISICIGHSDLKNAPMKEKHLERSWRLTVDSHLLTVKLTNEEHSCPL